MADAPLPVPAKNREVGKEPTATRKENQSSDAPEPKTDAATGTPSYVCWGVCLYPRRRSPDSICRTLLQNSETLVILFPPPSIDPLSSRRPQRVALVVCSVLTTPGLQ